MKISLDRIKDGGAQMREEMKPDTVREYADEMADGATFPPVIVFYDATDYWLADGYHRVDAARKIDRDEIDADVREGNQRDAILHGVGANAAHGLRRTQADKRRAVETHNAVGRAPVLTLHRHHNTAGDHRRPTGPASIYSPVHVGIAAAQRRRVETV